MKYPTPRYEATENDDYLELYSRDGTYRGVMFADGMAALEAMRPGRAELDCSAIRQGFLPRGATLVSSPGVDEAAFAGDEEGLSRARAAIAEATYITLKRNWTARRQAPAAAARYDAMTVPPATIPRSVH